MKKAPLWFSFLLALLTALFGTAIFANIRLIAFTPFFAILYNRTTLLTSLWVATLTGIIIDLLCSQLRFGLYALNYCLTTLVLYKQKRHFFEDKPLALSLFTALVSCVSTSIQIFLIYTFDNELPLSWKLAATDLLGMPCIDACYAFLWFSCPIMIYQYTQRIGWRAIWIRLRNYIQLPFES